MTILFDLTAVYDHLTGIERYAINTAKYIIAAHPENSYILLFKNEIHPSLAKESALPNVRVQVIGGCNKLLFNQLVLPMKLRSCRADRYFFPCFQSPLLFRRKGIVNTIHDLAVWDCPETIKPIMVPYHRLSYLNAARVSRSIMTVSYFSKGRICKKLHVDERRVGVSFSGVSEQFLEPDVNAEKLAYVRKKYSLPKKYLLCLSTVEPRKNMSLLIKAVAELRKEGKLDAELVLAGRSGWKTKQALGSLSSRTHLTGFIDDCDLPAVYRGAEAFVFPSLYEGFGLPVVEAMACGTPVISSDAASLPEAAGDSGLLFESGSVSSLKCAILKLLAMPEDEREKLRSRAHRHAQKFAWETVAERVYHRICK